LNNRNITLLLVVFRVQQVQYSAKSYYSV